MRRLAYEAADSGLLSPDLAAGIRRVKGVTIVFNESCLYRHLKSSIDYYRRSRTHLALEKDSPEPRPIQPPASGRIVAIPEVGGLHHRYERRAA